MTTFVGRSARSGELLSVETRAGVITAITRRADPTGQVPFLAPGLVDLQVNGFAGADVNAETGDRELLRQITDALALRGVTTWVPTIVTAAEEQIHDRLRRVVAARTAWSEVDRAIPFCHVEGPFISDRDGPRGAHPREHIRPVDPAEVRRWSRTGPVGYLTLSPHHDDDPAAIAEIVDGGVSVAIGHTDATPARITAAVDAGATLATHVGNGIAAVLPRHPNPLWSILAEDRLTCGFIADGHHLPAEVITVMLRATGRGRAFLVSDAVELAGAPAGRHRTVVGGDVDLSEDGRLTLSDSGLLAGAVRSLADGVTRMVSWGFGLADALDLASLAPGTVVGRIGSGPPPGRLRIGGPADLTEWDPAGRLVGVVRAGRRLR